MAFNLKKVLKALLFSSSQPLAIWRRGLLKKALAHRRCP